MNTLIDRIESLINGTPSGDNRNELTNINIILHQQLNLCYGCKKDPTICTDRLVNFGSGIDTSNIIKCTGYEHRE